MLNLKVVIDTNIFVSGAMKTTGIPRIVIDTVMETDGITIIYSDEIFEEYLDVLNRKKLKLPIMTVNSFIGLILKNGEKISPFPQFAYFNDESDKKFYEAFKTADADYLITGNSKHFPDEDGIVSPRQFAELHGVQIQ